MKEKNNGCINCRTLIFVAAAFFCTIVGVAKTTNSGVSGKVLYANDSLYVEVSNNSNDTIYVFDTYLKKYYGYCLAEAKYLRRYNYNTDRFAISFLPIKPYLSAGLSDLIRLGDNAVVNSGCLWYSFTAIPPLEARTFSVPRTILSACDYFEDFDLNKIFTWQPYMDLKHLGYFHPQTLTLKFAIYKNIDIFADRWNLVKLWIEFNEHVNRFIELNIPVCNCTCDN